MLHMTQRTESTNTAAREALRFGVAWLLGIIGGALCGAALNAVFDLLCRDVRPVDGFSSPYLAAASFGAFIGAILGAIITPIAYPWLIRSTGLQKAFWAAMIGTMLGGFLSVFFSAAALVLFGGSSDLVLGSLVTSTLFPICFFFVALGWAAPRTPKVTANKPAV